MNALIGIKIGYNNVLSKENVYFLGQTVRLCFDIQKEGTTSEFMFTFLAVLSIWVEILFERVLKIFSNCVFHEIFIENIDSLNFIERRTIQSNLALRNG